LHQVGDLFELDLKLRYQKVNVDASGIYINISMLWISKRPPHVWKGVQVHTAN